MISGETLCDMEATIRQSSPIPEAKLARWRPFGIDHTQQPLARRPRPETWNLHMLSNPVVTTYLMLILVGVAGAVGDILVSRWAKTDGIGWLLGSWLFWIASVTLFGYFLKSDRFAFSTAISFIAFAAHGVVSLLFDFLFLQTRLSREEWLGIALAIIAVLVLEVGRVRREETATLAATTLAAASIPTEEVR